jgi:hypothetical protein
MDDADLEPDPRRRVPTVLWLALGLLLIVVFSLALLFLHGRGAPYAVGPPAGSPPAH